jgi:hypothetical protein
VSSLNNGILSRLLPENIKLDFIEDYDNLFHRTYYLNKLVKMAQTPIISLWDSDVLVDKKQIEQSVSLIRKGEIDIVLPYKEKFLDTSVLVKELYMKKNSISVLKANENKMRSLYAPESVGGALFAKKDSYIKAGMENEKLYGWGNHDGERYNRWEILGFRVQRVDGPMYHFSHTRSANSKYHSKKQPELKNAELERLAFMSKNEMKNEINNW